MNPLHVVFGLRGVFVRQGKSFKFCILILVEWYRHYYKMWVQFISPRSLDKWIHCFPYRFIITNEFLVKTRFLVIFKVKELKKSDEIIHGRPKKKDEILNRDLSNSKIVHIVGVWSADLGVFLSQPHFGLSVRMKFTLPKVGTWSPPGLPKTQSSIVGVKTPCIEVFFIPLERFWSVDAQNGLAWAIWTSAAQVMGKRRAGNQTGNLTPDH